MALEAKNIKYIAIQGAGGKGAAYLGALSALEEAGVLKSSKNNAKDGTKRFDNLEGISGISAGSITALMLSLGYSASETNAMVIESPLFSLALGEKSDNLFYRAYNNIETNEAEIGFTSFTKKRKPKPHGDKYILSDTYIKFKENSLKSDYRLLSKIFKFSFPSHAIITGLIKSLTSSDILENITDEIVDDIYPYILSLNQFFMVGDLAKRSESRKIRKQLEEFGFDFDLLYEIKKSLEEHKKHTTLAIGGVISLLVWYFAFYTAANYYAEGVFDSEDDTKDDNICSKKNQRKKRNYEKWSTIKIYIRLIWNANVNVKSGSPIRKIPIVNQLMKVIDEPFTIGEGNLKDKKRALLNLSILTAEAIAAVKDKTISDLITKMLVKEIIPTFLKPISIMLKTGGILSGARVRYLQARLIYEKVKVVEKNGECTSFKIREASFSEKLKDDLEKFEEVKLSKKNIRDYKALEKRYEELNKSSQDTIIEMKILSADLEKLKITISKEISEKFTNNSHVLDYFKYQRNNKVNNLDGKFDELDNIGLELEIVSYIIDAFKMRKHLKYIEKHYSFEKHYELFPHELIICASNLTSGESVYFNRHLTPDFPIVEAVTASMNIPGLWRPSAISYEPKSRGKQKNGTTDSDFYKKHYYGWFVDGGINNIIPLFAFNGYEDVKKYEEAWYWTPEEKAKNNDLFPENKIVGISNFGGYCQGAKYAGGHKAKDDKEKGEWHKESFVKQYDFVSLVGDIFGSMFEYSYKVKGFELEPYRSHILTVDYGFMGILDFVANTEEVFRTEIMNYEYALDFLGEKITKEAKKKLIHTWKNGEKKARKKARGTGNMFKRKKMGYRKDEYNFFKFK